MSHLKERGEKVCLNCGTNLHGRYCHVCGQENLEPTETVWHLVSHFFQDITHFDGKFFSTGKDLLRKPGFLSAEYVAGRRASYLNPIRMYIFISALFFIVLFSVKSGGIATVNVKPGKGTSQGGALRVRSGTNFMGWDQSQYHSLAQYDSIQQSLPSERRDGWFKHTLMRRFMRGDDEFLKDRKGFLEKYNENVTHSLPKILFLSLPFFALLLKLLYLRRKQYLYVDHGIFTLHVYSAQFIFMLAALLLKGIADLVGPQWVSKGADMLNLLIVLGSVFYVYKAMRKFYRQRRGKTILKFGLLVLFALILNLALLILLVLVSAITIV